MVIVDKETGWQYKPAQALLHRDGGKLYVYDSLLSEFAAMGFEYGYSVADPMPWSCWEAQFGDFANGGADDHRRVHLIRRGRSGGSDRT
jgi:2-oxoglutarate dehydrogenase E1 component